MVLPCRHLKIIQLLALILACCIIKITLHNGSLWSAMTDLCPPKASCNLQETF